MSNPKNEFSYHVIAKALFENYECIYDIDVETSAYQCYHESGSYGSLRIAKSGEDFFRSLGTRIPRVIHPDDREFVHRMLRKETMLAALEHEKYHSFVYRLIVDGKPLYHKIRAVMAEVDGHPHILLGIRDVDDTIRTEKLHTEMIASMEQKDRELKALEEALSVSRMRSLTGQMQPHFLYNALGSIQEIVLENPAYAAELIGDFTVYLRSLLRAMKSDDPIPFTQELTNIWAYVNIEKMRFGEKLRVVYDIIASEFSVPTLSIQPLVENAICHGIYERGNDGGTVTLRTSESEKNWIVTVSDDGVGFDVAAVTAGIDSGESDSTGLRNAVYRLKYIVGADVSIDSTPGTGTTVTVTIPKGGLKQ